MPTVDREIVKTRLTALPQVGAADVRRALLDLGRDGQVDAADRAVVDAFAAKMDAPGKARLAGFFGDAGAPPPPRTRPSTMPALAEVAAGTKVLVEGAQGPAVQALQQALVDVGFADWAPTQTFGPKTKAALTDFQVQHNARLLQTRSAKAPLAVDGQLGRGTLAALDEAFAALPAVAVAGQGGQLDRADVLIDLTHQIAWVNAAAVDTAKLGGLLDRLAVEPQPASQAAYAALRTRLQDGGAVVDDFAKNGAASERELGLADSDGSTRVFVPFKVAVGEKDGAGWLTPTGSFVVGDKRKSREGARWGHPNGFAKDPQNPYGPRWMRLYRETPGGLSHTAYGLHGTTSTAQWPTLPDGGRAVSHGCVRFENPDIIKLFEYLQDGARVRIVESVADRPADPLLV